MNKILHLCGQNRAILGILNSAKPTVNSKLAFWYKPIEISYRYYSQQLRVARAPLNINPAAVVKDVIVYKYENPKYFKYMNLFALVQFAMFSAYSQFTMAELRDTPVNKSEQAESLPWYSKFNLGNPTFRYGLSIGCFVIGFAIITVIWTFTLRSVRFLILRKGGADISLVTYGPLGTNRITTVPLRCVSGLESRESARSFLPIKVKDIRWFYVLDTRGEYLQKDLFDHVINLKRRI